MCFPCLLRVPLLFSLLVRQQETAEGDQERQLNNGLQDVLDESSSRILLPKDIVKGQRLVCASRLMLSSSSLSANGMRCWYCAFISDVVC